MRKKLLYLFLIFIAIAFIFNTGCSKNEIKSIKSSYKKVKVVMDDNYPPYVFRDSSGNLKGILIDEWKLWEKKTGIKAEITAISWDNALNSMKSNQYDVIDTIFFNEERAISFDFTKPYAAIQVPIFFNENISGITDIDTLKGFQVAVKKGDNSEKLLKDKGITDIIEFNNYEDIINAAKEKKIMVFIMDKPPALYYMSKVNIIDKFKFSEPLYEGEFHRAVKKGNSDLLNTVENGFSLITDKEYKDIEDKWFGSNYYYPGYIKYINYAAGFIVLIVMLLILWNHTLKRKVEMKTLELTNVMKKLKGSEERYRGLLTKINVGVAVFSNTGKIIISNDEFKKIFGQIEKVIFNDSQIIINSKGTIIKDESYLVDRVMSTKSPVNDLTLGVIKQNSKEIKWVKADLTPEFDKNNNIEDIIGTFADITERKNAVEALQESEYKIRTIIETIPDLVFILSREGVFIDYLSKDNKTYNERDFIGKCAFDIFPEDISQGFKKSIESVNGDGKAEVYEYPLLMNNKLCYFEARFVNYGPNKILTIVRDITERKTAEKKMFYMNMHDSLTGLYNRNYFEMELQRYSNHGITDAALIICDIDGLKLVNDTMGHGEGDKYIRITANILKTCFHENDVIARIGGDEFAVLVQHVNEDIINRIKDKVKNMVKGYNDGYHIPVSISLGYAILGDSKTINDVFKEADDYMYRGKLHNIQSSRSRNLDILMKMLEVRDFNTEGHGERLMESVVALCRKFGMSESEIKDMRLFAQFHDIGKIGIPDSVLFKAGKLSSEEWTIMKKHSDIGYRIAKTSPDLVHISDWILKHHEKWDGTGYPFGLKGKEIPIQCRILTIIDSYDAMTNDRPYRKGMSKEAAIEEFKLSSGKQFDPLLVNMFLSLL